MLIGMSQIAAGDIASKTHMVEIGALRAQAGLDIAQALTLGQLREGEAEGRDT